MSKAKEKSREYVLPFLDKQYEKYGEHKQMELSRFDGYDMMSAYEEGYHQAEKDLELTWEDIENIITISYKLDKEEEISGKYAKLMTHYQEVLKRYKDFKERKEK